MIMSRPLFLCLLLLTTQVFAEDSVDSLLRSIESQTGKDLSAIEQREARFREQHQSIKQQLSALEKDIASAKAEEKKLKGQIDKNDETIAGLDRRISQQAGNLGELEGVVHQVVGDSLGQYEHSLLTAEFPERIKKAKALLSIEGIPNYQELEEIWFLLLQDTIESGKVSRFQAQVSDAQGERKSQQVTRVGGFVAVANGDYLGPANDAISLISYAQQPESSIRSTAKAFEELAPGQLGSMVIDPTAGEILSMLAQRPDLVERFKQGNVIGMLIAIIAVFGVLIAAERLFTLSKLETAMLKQKSSESISSDNPLGRILGLATTATTMDSELLERKIDEGIYRESAEFEKRIGLIKMFAVIAPMLGLLGTVTGMIETFQSITLFGTGDPKLMAGGISQALVTTALGLIAAIPLLFVHNIVRSKNTRCVNLLEEQTAGLLVKHLEKNAQ